MHTARLTPGLERMHTARVAFGWRPLAGVRLYSVWWDACERLAACSVPVLCMSVAGMVVIVAGDIVQRSTVSRGSVPSSLGAQALLLALAIPLAVGGAQLRATFGKPPRRFGLALTALALHTVIQTALLSAPVIVIDAWGQAAELDRVKVRRVPGMFGAMLQASVLRTLDQMAAVSGSTLGELAPTVRASTAGVWNDLAATTYDFDAALADDERVSNGAGVGRVKTIAPRAVATLLWIAAFAWGVIAIAEGTLRLHAVAIAHALGEGLTVRAGMEQSARLSASGIGAVAAHSLAMRMACFVTVLILVSWPQVFLEAAPQAQHVTRMVSGFGLDYVRATAQNLAWCVLIAFWQALCAICDVRLYIEVAARETGSGI